MVESTGLQRPHQLRNPMYIFVDLMLIGVLTPGTTKYKMNTTAVMAMAGSAIRIHKDSTANNIPRSQSRATGRNGSRMAKRRTEVRRIAKQPLRRRTRWRSSGAIVGQNGTAREPFPID